MINWEDACRHLSERDPVLGKIIQSYTGERLVPRGDAFLTLARAIIGQQISVKAADSIFARVQTLVEVVAPHNVVSADPDRLRACGLSARKVEYLTGIARAFDEKTLRPELWPDQDDEQILKALIALRGIGRWTAEMFLIFHLQRPDVLPLDDVGLLRSSATHFGWESDFHPDKLKERAERWSPYRTVAVWYLWRALDPIPVAY